MSDEKKNFKSAFVGNFKKGGTRLIIAIVVFIVLAFAIVVVRGQNKLATGNASFASVPDPHSGRANNFEDPLRRKLIDQDDANRLKEAKEKAGASSVTPTLPDKALPGDRLLNNIAHDHEVGAPREPGQPAAPGGQPNQTQTTATQQQLQQLAAMAEQKRLQQERDAKDLREKQITADERYMKGLTDHWNNLAEMRIITVSKSSLDTSALSNGITGAAGHANQLGAALVQAGKVVYVRNILKLDSDKPGTPVVAEVQDANFLHGAKLFGSFKLLDDQLLIILNRMNWNGQDYQINAVAFDPETNSPAFSDESDPRYVQRYGLQLGAQFVAGLAKVAQEAGQDSIVTPQGAVVVSQPKPNLKEALWGGASGFAQGLSSDIGEAAPKGAWAGMFANSGMAVMFMDTVRENQLSLSSSTGSIANPSMSGLQDQFTGATRGGQSGLSQQAQQQAAIAATQSVQASQQAALAQAAKSLSPSPNQQ